MMADNRSSATWEPSQGYHAPTAPEGYLRASEARALLGVGDKYFEKLVLKFKRLGQLEVLVEPGKTHGFYRREDVEAIARTLWEANLSVVEHRLQKVQVAQATIWDVPGINAVLASLGWPSASEGERTALLRHNPQTDWLVRYHSLILGYGNMRPYRRRARHPDTGEEIDVLEEVLAGRIEGRGARPWMLSRFEDGGTYECFIGITVRDVPHREQYAMRLIRGWQRALCRMASERGIFIRRLYATSDRHLLGQPLPEEGRPREPNLPELARKLGFVVQSNQPGDRVLNEEVGLPAVRYCLDLETSPVRWAHRYQECVELGRHREAAKTVASRVLPEPPFSLLPALHTTFQTLVHVPHADIARDSMIVGALKPFLSVLARDPRLTSQEQLEVGLLVAQLDSLQETYLPPDEDEDESGGGSD